MNHLHAPPPLPHTEVPQGAATWRTAQLRVLVADDCAVDRLLACAALSHWGIAPKIACNGEEAVRLVSEEAFDLILMDLVMPVMDGFAATRGIRRFESSRLFRLAVPVLAYTGEELPMRAAQLRYSGLDGVLKKPCDHRAMKECLERWCAGFFTPLAVDEPMRSAAAAQSPSSASVNR